MFKVYKIVLALVELFFGIPLLGGAIILSHGWTPLAVLFLFHIVGAFIASNGQKKKTGHIIGILGNLLGVIPFVGMSFHIATGIVLFIEGVTDK